MFSIRDKSRIQLDSRTLKISQPLLIANLDGGESTVSSFIYFGYLIIFLVALQSTISSTRAQAKHMAGRLDLFKCCLTMALWTRPNLLQHNFFKIIIFSCVVFLCTLECKRYLVPHVYISPSYLILVHTGSLVPQLYEELFLFRTNLRPTSFVLFCVIV